ncbi:MULTISPECIES: undecaprenyldiphospho-muramoylpentapeptide beta-N-acetylglucosaminyltransferase [Nocardiopsis]|jgi:UDP-N-acetylglucosamine--N-acetylmuramyl-(pentapeptide) pyrophosphoryl-undecaprenol N-acetylglucosamine transferase|uniref:UDP-N-acetylglucosamine--N-acetylmuramyl-(pentapeptide) pyrophosphoryl-undecaprenol N-acetylglucosamine transferase n=1 Tax=Nocardiopsis dassonvillei (strain ATCC 23218 / DSM 43111 / CIP 107115 / JCM 7437 / KCTC 9190 / NBRC 14626 / NCTC 10488 / NRRL B-5397 / IMRU 509) TaxID=446468 RepID=D7B0D4_NOCDD|nr:MULTISPECIES: undecaprenyldiphospho-muramoylpentapeptide beta-N-acetylglucosaminyltransferase [Nocardiopsis]ADH66341.1 UDP-N-acetylglucosamine--N-acetylmuramyl- (pentapeptide) pyrophosphoryl-undecaprenol N-acetylglucosamine transferase [Nocardiopsis dassonvillei subsp. dassonvillei DSM 43111]APC34662.1 undecaprenyldiphospho-muramoylpentapeptide beta-N-acetylglucosaminyltransferase [Nocardiopsis dassonvillei]NKY79978.1 undecaprenyldiphospho-muramoylpentapeptide beta-N-acetylglucosaminyltransfe
MRVALAGGGTAGHIEPALSLADALRRMDPSTEILCLGTERGLETRLVPMRGYELGIIPAVPLPRRLTPQLLSVPGKLAGALSAAGEHLDRLQADIIVGFGGYVATPGYLAARRRRIPIVVHEANPLPGLANRLGARLTPHVFTGHPHTQIRNGRFVGIPLREQITSLDRLAMGDKARTYFGLRHDLPTLLIFGGSQGAQRINETAYAARDAFRDSGVQVLHVVGPKNADEPQDLTQMGIPYVAVPYVDRMDMAYAAADVAMCRSGAMTCAELTAVGLPGAFVPLAIGNGEQALNAEPIVQAGGGMMVNNADVSVEWITQQLIPLLTDTDRVVAMSEAAARMGRRDADMELAREVTAIARGDKPTPDMPVSEDDGDEAFYDDGKDTR